MNKHEADSLTSDALDIKVGKCLSAIQDGYTLYRTLTDKSLEGGEGNIDPAIERQLLEHLQYMASLLVGIGSRFLQEGKMQVAILDQTGEPQSTMMQLASNGKVRAQRFLEALEKEVNGLVMASIERDPAINPTALPALPVKKPSGGLN